MVTTRGSTKAADTALPPLSSAPKSKAKFSPAKSQAKKKKKTTEDVEDTGEVDVPPSGQKEKTVKVVRQVIGKRKRTSGAREVSNVSPFSKSPHVKEEEHETRPFPEDSPRPEFSITSLQSLVSRIQQHAKCGQCGTSLEKVIACQFHRDVYCVRPKTQCHGETCLGCGEDVNRPTIARSQQFNSGVDPLYHCRNGWYVALWMQLAYANSTRAPPGLQENITNDDITKSSANSLSSKPSKQSNRSVPAGTGYASGNPNSSGMPAPKTKTEFAGKEKAADERDELIFATLASLIKNSPSSIEQRKSERDDPEPLQKKARASRLSNPITEKQDDDRTNDGPLIASMFHWSGVLQNLARLFRNDSLEDAVSRRKLYERALELTNALLSTPLTSSLVMQKTYNATRVTETVPDTRFTAMPAFLSKIDTAEGSSFSAYDDGLEGPSIADSLDNILMVCETLVNAAAAMPKAYKDRASRDMVECANEIQELGKRLGKDVTKRKPAPDAVLPQAAPSDSRFEMVEEADITKRYMRLKETNLKMSSSGTHQRMRTLHKEVAILRTSLPPGIWVKMASARPDLMKAVIVGPEGTPYEGGLFEFDIFCPKEYPRLPPKVECSTAAREEARQFSLNPNLYNSGYVCLSLINTWHGAKEEQWQQGKSTILQVLLSIQSMVLGTATPADNEPGGLGLSHKDYNRTVQPGTIKAAMLPWLQVEELRKGLWQSEVEAYFKANAKNVIETVRSWSKENTRITEFSQYPFFPPMPPPAALANVHPPPPFGPPPVATEPQSSAGANQPSGANSSVAGTSTPQAHNAPSLPGLNAPSNLPEGHPPWGMTDDEMMDLELHDHVPHSLADLMGPGQGWQWVGPHSAQPDIEAQTTAWAPRTRAVEPKVKSVNLLVELEKALKEYL